MKIALLIFMLFAHIVNDYYLQGWLASAKTKNWWKKNAPDKLYSKDYHKNILPGFRTGTISTLMINEDFE